MASSLDTTSLARSSSSHLRLVDPAAVGVSAHMLAGEGHVLDATGRHGEARALYERALHSLREASPALASTILRSIARSYELDHDFRAAADCAEASVAVAEQSENVEVLGRALTSLATAQWRQGDLAGAERLLHQAVDHDGGANHARLRVDAMCTLGALAKVRGDFREALRCYDDALSHARRDALLDSVVVAHGHIGIANRELGRFDLAAESLAEGLSIANALGGLSARIHLEINYATLEIERGDLTEAKRRCDRGSALAAHLGAAHTNGEVERVCGVIAREAGDLVAAEAHLSRARSIGAGALDLTLEGDANRELAKLYHRLGRNREMLQALIQAHACYTTLSARHELPDAVRRMLRLEEYFLEVVRSWSESIEARDEFTRGHCERVADLASALAVKIGLEEPSLFWFQIGAMLHDVGKLIVPAELLNKTSGLGDEERALVQRHTEAGVEMLTGIALPSTVLPMVRSHHERWDGHGYPDQLAGAEIPVAARILGIADVYDALVSDRGYKRAFTHLEAMEIMRREVGRQFDPLLFARFEELVRRGTVTMPHTTSTGLTARRSGQTAVVSAVEEDDLTGTLVRRAFTAMTAVALSEGRRTATPLSLLVVDIDQFKSVNDAHGHLVGDDVLRLVAGLIRQQLRPEQYLGRYAGDEFVVLLPGLDLEEACVMAGTIRRLTAALPIPLRDHEGRAVSVTLSIGVAAAPRHGESFETLFTAADRALFEAKREGRDKVVAAGTSSDGATELVLSSVVGRGAELRSLISALDDSVHGTPQLRIVLGEAGVGKSTLVRQLLPEARLRGATMGSGRALESGSRPAYGPWADLLKGLHELKLVPVRRWPLLERIAPALRATDSRRRVLQPVEASQSHQLADELVAYLRAASVSCPLVIVMEDMQWADAASWDALEYLLAELATERIVLAVTLRAEDARSGDVRERRRRLVRDVRTREVLLLPLAVGEVRSWMHAVLRRTDESDQLVDFVMQRTEGNPCLVMQLLRALDNTGAFSDTGAAWVWKSPASLVLPDDMVDLLARRLTPLNNDVLRVLAAAAAIGREFSLELLAEAADVTMERVLDAVDAGVAASVLAPCAHGEHYGFTHALLVHAVSRTVSGARQRLMHERIATLLAARAPQNVNEIAEHFAQSGNARLAYSWCRTAGAAALAGYALDDAARFLELALTHARCAEEKATVQEELALVAELSGRWADVERWCDTLIASTVVSGDTVRTLPVELRRLRARVRQGQGASETEIVCRELLETAERVGRPTEIIQARSQLVLARSRAGATDEAVKLAEGSMRIAEDADDGALVTEAAHRLAITLLAVRPNEAVELLLGVVTRAQSVRDRIMEARAFLALGVARTRTRDDSAARTALRAAQSVARDAQSLDLAATASMNLGVLELRAGNFVAAYTACNDAQRWYATLGNTTSRLIALYHLAGLEGERGDSEAAARLYAEVAALAGALEPTDVSVGTRAGLGLTALRLHDVHTAQAERARALALLALLGEQSGSWFYGCELLESLVVRLAVHEGAFDTARARFHHAVERLERSDVYAAAWLVADCAGELVTHDRSVWVDVVRLSTHATERQWVLLSARFTALRDLVERTAPARRHDGRAQDVGSAPSLPIDQGGIDHGGLHHIGNVAAQLHVSGALATTVHPVGEQHHE